MPKALAQSKSFLFHFRFQDLRKKIIARAAARTLSRATPPGLIFSNKPTAVAAPLYCEMPPRINKNSGEALLLERLRLKAI
jgi:hypothetical protein